MIILKKGIIFSNSFFLIYFSLGTKNQLILCYNHNIDFQLFSNDEIFDKNSSLIKELLKIKSKKIKYNRNYNKEDIHKLFNNNINKIEKKKKKIKSNKTEFNNIEVNKKESNKKIIDKNIDKKINPILTKYKYLNVMKQSKIDNYFK